MPLKWWQVLLAGVIATASMDVPSMIPWLLMFPAMGYGFFGAHGPEGTRLFVSSLASHAFFGLGIWIALRVMSLT